MRSQGEEGRVLSGNSVKGQVKSSVRNEMEAIAIVDVTATLKQLQDQGRDGWGLPIRLSPTQTLASGPCCSLNSTSTRVAGASCASLPSLHHLLCSNLFQIIGPSTIFLEMSEAIKYMDIEVSL